MLVADKLDKLLRADTGSVAEGEAFGEQLNKTELHSIADEPKWEYGDEQ